MEPFSPFQAKVITHQWLHFCLATLGAVILVPDESSACSAVLVNVWTWLHVRARPPKTEETALGGRLAKMGHKMMNVAAFFSPVGLHLQDRRRRDCYHFSSTSTWTRLGMIYLRRKSTYSDILLLIALNFGKSDSSSNSDLLMWNQMASVIKVANCQISILVTLK